jgi:hypothetical protein
MVLPVADAHGVEPWPVIAKVYRRKSRGLVRWTTLAKK